MKEQLVWRPASPLRVGEGGKEGEGIQLCQSRVKSKDMCLPSSPICHKSYYRATRGKEKPRASPDIQEVSGDAPTPDYDGQTRRCCCCWQPEIPTPSMPALCHEMPFPSRWEKMSLQQTANIPQTGHWKKTTGTNKREGQATHPKM